MPNKIHLHVPKTRLSLEQDENLSKNAILPNFERSSVNKDKIRFFVLLPLPIKNFIISFLTMDGLAAILDREN